MLDEQAQPLTELYSLVDSDIGMRMFQTRTALRAGLVTCVKETYAEAEACCAKHEHAGPVYRFFEDFGLNYACQVDVGTGDWD